VSLCKRVEAALEPAYGHGQVMGGKWYQCTNATERALLCPPDPLTLADLDMMRGLEAQGLELAGHFAECLGEFRFLLESRQVPGSSVMPLQCD